MTDYPIDPELQPWLAMLPSIELTDIVASRAAMDELLKVLPAVEIPAGIEIREVSIPGRDGAPDIKARVYAPTDSDGSLRPGYLNIHGGGFVMGDLDTFEQAPVDVAATGVVVVAPDYRLAPEHPFPAGLEDCYAALEWLAGNAAELGVDPQRIAVGGESAGGGLAAAVALLARDRQGPAICFQLLDIPELDDRLETLSMRTFVDTPIWNRPSAELSWKYYLSGAPEVLGLQYAAPSRAEDFAGLPPAFVAVCEFDPLRDEGLIYAQRLLAAGVSTELHHYPGTFHGSGIVQAAAITRRMLADKATALAKALGTS
ncbi:acetyl esterase/lipase [Kribbella sp. VKM Ac-2527]|uniref:Acetyl esterase/lipase n=1 Tax=Kribbella caucasensis TaxID=2512215 RepID=A0A4R6K7D2_9ACTN|nr:alpha/beta hydrolase [Kribbella sp. VKM Ac-2527]TDO45366.1 acetyl esterase/lipase [Kribbella sp. VKM Ac-2527]